MRPCSILSIITFKRLTKFSPGRIRPGEKGTRMKIRSMHVGDKRGKLISFLRQQMDIEMVNILLVHESSISVTLLRCNKLFAKLLLHEDTIQYIKKSVCRRISREASRIPYTIHTGIVGTSSVRTIKNQEWVSNLSYDYDQSRSRDDLRIRNETNVKTYQFPTTDRVLWELHMSRNLRLNDYDDPIHGRRWVTAISLIERYQVIWNGIKHRLGFIHPGFGWEQGPTRYGRIFHNSKLIYGKSTLSKDESNVLQAFVTNQKDWFPLARVPQTKSGKLNGYQYMCLQRYTDLFYGDGHARPVPRMNPRPTA